MQLDPNFRSWLGAAILCRCEWLSYPESSTNRDAFAKKRAQAAETALRLQPKSWRGGVCQRFLSLRLPAETTTLPLIILSRHIGFCLTTAAFRSRWRMLNGGAATGTRATHTSTKPRNSIRAMLTCSHNTRVLTSAFVVSRKLWQSLSRF